MTRLLPLLAVLAVAAPILVAASLPHAALPSPLRAAPPAATAKAPDAPPVDKTVEAKRGTWSDWRGPAQNGWSPEHGLPDAFVMKKDDPNNNLVWSAPGYGGLTTPIIQNGRVYVIGHTGEGQGVQERVACFDEKDGHLIGEQKFNVFLTDMVEVRVGWTSLAGDPETGNVYAHATSGMFYCFDKDLKVLWSHSLTEEYGRVSGYGGRLNSPIVDGDLVIIGMLNGSWGELAIGGNRFVAFNKRTGDVVWWGGTGIRVSDTYASSPVVAVINGERLLITGGFAGVYAFKIRTGELAWSFELCHEAVNLTPVVDGNLVYIGHGEENENGTQGSVVCLDASKVVGGKPTQVWRVDGIKAKFASPVVKDGLVYVCNDVAVLFCLDAGTGVEKWHYQYGNETKGSPVLADGKIYIADVNGDFHVLKPSATDCTELNKIHFRPKNSVPTTIFGTPSILHGRVYFMTSEGLYCFGKKDEGAAALDAIPPLEKEAAPGDKPARLQIVPADVLLAPGDSADLKAYAFDAHGEPLGAVKVDWKLGPMHPPVYPPGITPPPPLPGSPPDLRGELRARPTARRPS